MKEPYNWDYTIRVKTKEGTFEYELETLEKIQEILNQYPNYEELEAKKKIKTLVKKKEMK